MSDAQTFLSCREYLHMSRKGHKILKRQTPEGFVFGSLDLMLLELGRQFKPAPRPKGVRKMKMGMCYRNAFQTLTYGAVEGAYCEGYAVNKRFPLPILHGWIVTPEGKVVDPTWDDGLDYWGVPIRPDWLAQTMAASGLYCVLDLPELKWPALRTPPHKWVDAKALKLPNGRWHNKRVKWFFE